MADKIDFKMLYFILSFLAVLNYSFSFAVTKKEEKCECYDICDKNFTTNSIKDIQKISACQRGCRFYSLVLHTSSHEGNPEKDAAHAKEGCLLSCSEGYINPFELLSCNFGCSVVESFKSCSVLEHQIPQISYSFVIEESDVLIHPGEPDPDDSLTDPGLRKQFQKTLVAILDATPKIPEIHFRNLPIRTEKLSELPHSSFKCPKLYGLDAKFEFRNGKIIVGDLYLFVAVFLFVVMCFVIGHHIETKNLAKKVLREAGLGNKDDFSEREPLFKLCLSPGDLVGKEKLPDQTIQKSDVFDLAANGSDPLDAKIGCITLVFDDDETSKDSQKEKNNIKI